MFLVKVPTSSADYRLKDSLSCFLPALIQSLSDGHKEGEGEEGGAQARHGICHESGHSCRRAYYVMQSCTKNTCNFNFYYQDTLHQQCVYLHGSTGQMPQLL